MNRAQGDAQKADYLFNTSYFNYYYKILEYNEWAKEQEKNFNDAKSKIGK